MLGVTLRNRRWTGWESVSIETSIETLADSFAVSLASNPQEFIAELYDGAPAIIDIDGKPLMAGYIERVRRYNSKATVSLGIEGRSKTGDLIDCTLGTGKTSWKNIGLLDLLVELCKPFGIKVTSQVSNLGEPFQKFTADGGKTIYEAIEKACGARGILPTSDANGDLVLLKTGSLSASDSLVQGANIKTIEHSTNYSERFSEVVVRGQQKGDGSAWKTVGFTATAKDPAIKRYRPLLVTADQTLTGKSAQEKANWEAQVRAGRSVNLLIETPSWTQTNGDLWEPNLLVNVVYPKFGISGKYLIVGVRYSLDDTGTNCSLRLDVPEVYAPEPPASVKQSNQTRIQL
jgi:prophage tail gpP-like protein